MKIGVIEGFFGPAWSESARRDYAPFLKRVGGDFYLYAPKRDPNLRRSWRDPWSEEYKDFLGSLAAHFRAHGIAFGVGLSPFGLGEKLTASDTSALAEKLGVFQGLGLKELGIFFDDMHPHANLAAVQAEVVRLVQQEFSGQILFCPSYYTPDPILEKVFGKMPEHYLEDIARLIPREVDIAWTGPKVISPEIPVEHLEATVKLLGRPPFIFENIFANDGPRNCKFLKLRAFSGREATGPGLVKSWGLNMMNQPLLSQITFLAALRVLKKGEDAEAAFELALRDLATPTLAEFILRHRRSFLEQGLDQLPEGEKASLRRELAAMPDPAAREIEGWLRGDYVVGPECLTD
jgi:hypothetical protein